ncbi:MAG: ABC transporter permease [Actinomycetota bacterium]
MIVVAAAALVFGAVALLALRNPLLGRMALREATRRRGQTALVIGGLMIGSAAITASLIGADSSRDSFLLDAYRAWGNVDVTVGTGAGFFPTAVVTRLSADPQVRADTDGISGGIQIVGSASNLTRRQGEPAVTVVGFDPARQRPFGAFVLASGKRTFGTDLPADGVILSRTLAEVLRARVGDVVSVHAERGAMTGPPVRLRVAGVARGEGPGAFGLRPTVFMPLGLARRVTGAPGINVVWVSANGGLITGVEGSRAAARAVRAGLRSAGFPGLRVREAKAEEVDSARQSTQFLTTMLVAMSMLIVAAGVALVVNLVTMLAEERRPRHGVLRALGLTRGKLVRLSIIEGAMYSLAAALVGTAVGIVAGRVIAARFARAFSQFFGGETDFHFRFALKPSTLAVSFAGGALITLLTVAVAARRTSRMSIPAAIRDLPEPARERRRPRARTVVIVVGTLAGLGLLAIPSRLPRLVGGTIVIVVAAAALKPRVSGRAYATLLGAGLAGWAFAMTATLSDPSLDFSEFFSVFTIAVLLSVFGLSILAAANLRLAERGLGVLGRASTGITRSIRVPLAYLARRPLRTGLTTGMFAVIMAILALFSVFLFTFRPQYERDSAGFDVRVTATAARSITLPPAVEAAVERTVAVPTLGYVGPVQNPQFSTGSIFLPMYLMDPGRGPAQPVRVAQKELRFDDDDAVWRALFAGPRVLMTNFVSPGQQVTLLSPSGPVTYRVIASQQFGILDGIMGSPEALAPFRTLSRGVTVLSDVRSDASASGVARRIEAGLFSQGVDAETTHDLLDEAYRANKTFFSVIEVLMRMGLVVGILSLGILGLRAVVERRHVIGVLRALGYRKRGVMAGLVAEAGVTASLGVVVGVFAGVLMGFMFVRQQAGTPDFGVDAASLGGVLALVYLAVLAVTVGPAWRASRLPPAEAVRYSE